MNNYKTKGICSKEINFKVEDNIVTEIEYINGCDGNLKGISSLVKGMKVDDIIERLDGITCGPRKSSCPDQLANALKEYRANN